MLPAQRRWIAVAALALAIPCVSNPAAQSGVTLEALLAAPFPSEMVAAPGGGHVAWVENAKGARNVWAASSPDFSARS